MSTTKAYQADFTIVNLKQFMQYLGIKNHYTARNEYNNYLMLVNKKQGMKLTLNDLKKIDG